MIYTKYIHALWNIFQYSSSSLVVIRPIFYPQKYLYKKYKIQLSKNQKMKIFIIHVTFIFIKTKEYYIIIN